MKVKSEYILRELAGQNLVVPVGSEAVNFNGIITLNKSGKRLFEKLQEESSREDLIDMLLDQYEVSEKRATKDVDAFIRMLEKNKILE